MKVLDSLEIYELYEDFIKCCIIRADSLFTDDKAIFTLKNVDDVINRFIINPILTQESFENKIRSQFEGASRDVLLVFAHANWFWAMAPNDITSWRKQQVVKDVMDDDEIELIQDKFPVRGFGSAGLWHRQNKHAEITLVVLLIKQLLLLKEENLISDLSDANVYTENFCLKCKYDPDGDPEFISEDIWKLVPEGKLAMYNIILHLCAPDRYEPVASDNHKQRIANTFGALLDDSTLDVKGLNLDEKIYAIRKRITESWGDENFSFYEETLSDIWNYYSGVNEFDAFQAIQYKKAVIFYGPPGTSKTHSAVKLAENLIYQRYFSSPQNVRDYILNHPDITLARIHHLQLHSNYSYEDFIGGTQFVKGDTAKVPGYLPTLISQIVNDEYPNVLILDEINRVELSRLFGEFFSALEKRNVPIKTSVQGVTLRVPDNLYVIGTMNEIDFSLERLDFALRRRFVWLFYGYNPDLLRAIINSKINAQGSNIKTEEVDEFIDRCNTLNSKIDGYEELGKQYEIGHTFFSEVVDIHESFRQLESQPRLRLMKKGGATKVLWDISIRPMLDSFLGNLDQEAKETFINELRDDFLP
jgi:5-methylcytosine-specific restriction protein B